MIQLDSNKNLVLESVGSMKKQQMYVDMFIDATQSPICSFVPSIQVPVRLEICGSEEILIGEPVVNIVALWNTKENFNVTNLTADFQVAQPSKCSIVLWELWPNTKQSLQEYGPTIWSNFVSVNNKTGVMQVNHNSNPEYGNVTYTFYFTALTMG